MDRETLAGRIDHTVLGPATTPEDVARTVVEAADHGMNACVPPCYLDVATERAPETTVATVVGFPHGQHAPETKRAEAARAVEAGADEIDLVANVGRVRADDGDAVRSEIAAVVDAVDVPVKVIVETALLDDEEKRRAAACARDADADMVKTSTGFADGGATVPDVELLAEYLPVKASGGIGTYDDAMAMLDAGAARIGASSGVAILDGAPTAAER